MSSTGRSRVGRSAAQAGVFTAPRSEVVVVPLSWVRWHIQILSMREEVQSC